MSYTYITPSMPSAPSVYSEVQIRAEKFWGMGHEEWFALDITVKPSDDNYPPNEDPSSVVLEIIADLKNQGYTVTAFVESGGLQWYLDLSGV